MYNKVFFIFINLFIICICLPASESDDESTRKGVAKALAKEGATVVLLDYARAIMREVDNPILSIKLLIEANANVNACRWDNNGIHKSVLMHTFLTMTPLYWESKNSTMVEKTEAQKQEDAHMIQNRFAIMQMLVNAGANVHWHPKKYNSQTILNLAGKWKATDKEFYFLLQQNPNPESCELVSLKWVEFKNIKDKHRQWHTQTYRPAIQQQLLSYLPVFMKGTEAPLGGIIDEYLELPKDF